MYDCCVGVVSKYACVCVCMYEGMQAQLRARLVSCRGPDGRREGGELDSRVFGESDKSDKISLELKLCCQHVLSWPAFCPPLSPVNPPPLCPAQGLALRRGTHTLSGTGMKAWYGLTAFLSTETGLSQSSLKKHQKLKHRKCLIRQLINNLLQFSFILISC